MIEKPRNISNATAKELDKVEAQLAKTEQDIKSMTMDKASEAPMEDKEVQTQLSSKEMEVAGETYLKPKRAIGCRDKFNDAFKSKREFDLQYVRFIAENSEIIGEAIDIWTRPYGGMPAEEWIVPVNKPVWGPRYLAEQIKRKHYTKLVMSDGVTTSSEGGAQFYGTLTAERRVHRLNAISAPLEKTLAMGFASNF